MLHSKIKTSAIAILNRCQTAEITPGGGFLFDYKSLHEWLKDCYLANLSDASMKL
jgi:hypothetical protein